jgi:hypothetical protein
VYSVKEGDLEKVRKERKSRINSTKKRRAKDKKESGGKKLGWERNF